MTRVRDLIFTIDPYADLDLAGFAPDPDTQGWGCRDPFFTTLIAEIGTWNGASAVHMARLLARLGIRDAEREICLGAIWRRTVRAAAGAARGGRAGAGR